MVTTRGTCDETDSGQGEGKNENTEKSKTARKGLMYEDKQRQIREAVESEPPDMAKLRQLAISPGGFVTDDLRRKAWPKLLNIDTENIPPKPEAEVLQAHRDYNQVVMDVNRSLKRFPPGMDEDVRLGIQDQLVDLILRVLVNNDELHHYLKNGMDEDVRLGLQDQLVDLIMRVLVNNDELHYYQGYHDICVTFLLVVGEDVAFALVDKLSQNHLRDFMDANMDRTKRMLNYLYPLLERVNPDLKDFMERSEVGTIFSLSWLITWYGHVLPDLKDIVRCYDFFIACHALMPIYLAAAIVLYRQEEILGSECEMCVLHGLLSRIPGDLPYERLIVKAGQLFLQFSPDTLARDAILNFKKQQSMAKARIQNRPRNHRKENRRSRWSAFFLQDGTNLYLKLTFWTLTAVCSAAVIAYFKPASWELGWWS